jgi:hypothetical protein
MVQRKQTRRQRGGGYQFGASITPGLVNNYGQEVVAGPKLMPDCVAAVKPDAMGFHGHKGLPGMGGGRRRSRKQSGGRYGFVSTDGAPPAAPWAGGLAPMSRIAPEMAVANPYNPPMSGGNNQAYYAPTAGYGNQASGWVGGTGSPVMIQVPYEARAMNPACLKTGGARRSRKAGRKGRKASRKGRKTNRR